MIELGGGYVVLFCKVGKKGKPVPEERKLPAIDARGLIETAPHLYSYAPFPKEVEQVKAPEVEDVPEDDGLEQVVAKEVKTRKPRATKKDENK